MPNYSLLIATLQLAAASCSIYTREWLHYRLEGIICNLAAASVSTAEQFNYAFSMFQKLSHRL